MSSSGAEPPAFPLGPGLSRFLESGTAGASGSPPRKAATVILLRPAEGEGYEVFLVKRHRAVVFMGGAHVFPGGRVDPKTDPNAEAAAVREVEEECGVKLDVRGLALFARWVTPAIEPKRFDARFFVAPVPPGAAARMPDPERGEPGREGAEVTEGAWMTPAAAVSAAERGEIILPPPTLWNLADLAGLPTIEAVLAEAARRRAEGIVPVEPRPIAGEDGRLVLVLPGDPQFEDPSAPAPPADRKRRFELVDGRWRMRRG